MHLQAKVHARNSCGWEQHPIGLQENISRLHAIIFDVDLPANRRFKTCDAIIARLTEGASPRIVPSVPPKLPVVEDASIYYKPLTDKDQENISQFFQHLNGNR